MSSGWWCVALFVVIMLACMWYEERMRRRREMLRIINDCLRTAKDINDMLKRGGK